MMTDSTKKRYSQESLISNRESFEMAVTNLPTLAQTLKEEDILQPEPEPPSNSSHFIKLGFSEKTIKESLCIRLGNWLNFEPFVQSSTLNNNW